MLLLHFQGGISPNLVCVSLAKIPGEFYANFRPVAYNTDTLLRCLCVSSYDNTLLGCVTFILNSTCGVCMLNRSCYMHERAAIICLEIAAPLRILAHEKIMQLNSYVSFPCCGVAIPVTPYVHKQIRNCVRAA